MRASNHPGADLPQRRTLREASQDRLDPAVEGRILVEDGGAIEQADATDRTAQDDIVMR